MYSQAVALWLCRFLRLVKNIVKNFFCFVDFHFWVRQKQLWPWQKPIQMLSQQLSSWRQFGRRHHAAERCSQAREKGAAPHRPRRNPHSSP